MSHTAYLVLENGKVFSGKAFGAVGDVTAEVVFTTGMSGYLETLTEKSFFGQIVVQTFPMIGNYGVIPADFESDMIAPSAYIVKEWCEFPSNFRAEGDLDTFFKEHGVVGLCGVDTRALTKCIRENGVMNGMITTDPSKADLEKIVRLELDKLVKRMANQGRTLKYSDALAAFLTEKGYQPEYGARPLRRAVERSVEDPLAEMILSGKLDHTIFADVKDGEIVFTKTKRKAK